MKNRNKTMTEFLTYSGVIAAIYVALTLLFEAISFGLSSSGSRNFCVCFVLYFRLPYLDCLWAVSSAISWRGLILRCYIWQFGYPHGRDGILCRPPS